MFLLLLCVSLCLNEKLFFIEHQGNDLLNQRNELISTCRHKIKFKLMNRKTWPLYEKCPCSELFSGANFFPAFGLNMETCRVSSHIHSECGVIRARPTPNTDTFHAVDVRTLLRYFNTIFCKFTVINWLNACENMKLLVPTNVVLFH